jgi:uncharacterized protein (TIGR03382 family)
VVVTAAHCLGVEPPNVHQVFFGPTLGSGGTLISVVGGRVHADYDPDTHVNDIAALILERDAQVAPMAMRTTPLPDLTDATVRMIGYGITDIAATVTGDKRSGTARVTGVDATQISMAPSPAMSCHGDSGGPVLADTGSGEELIGVTTHGDPACAQLGVAQRIDIHAAFLQAIIDEAAMPSTRRPFDPTEDFCAGSCATDADCPAETVCFGSQCAYHGLPAGTLGAACTGSASSCVSIPGGTCRTYAPCDVIAPPDGCCESGHPAWAPVMVVLLALRRRRRRRRG